MKAPLDQYGQKQPDLTNAEAALVWFLWIVIGFTFFAVMVLS